jgi:transcription elongation GreA/GreB family factor
MNLMLALGLESRCADLVRESIASQKAEVELLCWITRNMEKYEAWAPGMLPVLGFLVLSELERDYSGLRLKAQNLLRGRFEQAEWLKPVLEAMRDAQRRELVLKLKDSPGWEVVDRRSVLAVVVKLRPELQEALATGGAATAATASRGAFTSNRSYLERQQQLEKLVKVDIPQNTKEIAIARSYGDLSENHEFKAAKEMQGILLHRRGELEDMMGHVKPTDFQGFPHDRAGLATGVKLQYEDGRTELYYILGKWDKDEKLGIISCETRMAKALDGHKAGDCVVVPTEFGEVTCAIKEVTGLSEAVKSWIDGK